MELRRFTATHVALVYAAFGTAWILVSDRLVAALVPGSRTVAQNVKGIAFVVASAVLIYLLTRASRRSLARSRAELERASRQTDVLQRVLRHNVRNAVNVIRGYSEVIAEESEDPRQAEHAREVLDTADELIAISQKAKSLGEITEPEAAGEAVLDLATVARECAREIEREHPEGTVEVDLPETLRVEGHPRLDAAVENLVENGIEHNDAATPRVRVELVDAGPDRVTVAVTDNGPGVPEVEREVIEVGTETALVHSTGLGLWICRAAVDRSGGELRIEDGHGNGDGDGDGGVVAVTLPIPDGDRSSGGFDPDVPFPWPT